MQTIQSFAQPCKHILHHSTAHDRFQPDHLSTPLFSVGKISFEMYSQTITNESGVRLVCSDASIQPYPLNLRYNTFVAHVESPENKKLQFSARQKPPSVQKSDAPKGRVPQVRIIQGRFLNSALGPFLWGFFVESF